MYIFKTNRVARIRAKGKSKMPERRYNTPDPMATEAGIYEEKR